MPELVFCETTDWWTAKFRQVCPEFPLNIGAATMAELLPSGPTADSGLESGAIIAIELTAENGLPTASALQTLLSNSPACRAVALIQRELAGCQYGIRGLGFIEVICGPLELPRLARLTQRHVSLLPERKQAWRDAIHDRLPWTPAG